MLLDLENLNPGTWFKLEGGGEVCIRVCAGDDFRDIRKKTAHKKVEHVKKDNIIQRIEYVDIDDDRQSQLIWDYCIVDWKNFFDKDNAPIPCTPENKQLLMGKSVMFSKFIVECLDKMRVDTDKVTEIAE